MGCGRIGESRELDDDDAQRWISVAVDDLVRVLIV